MFALKTYPQSGIFAVNIFIRGMPQVITIDDYLGFYGSTNIRPIYARPSSDNAFWGAILEKVWAKANGNYEVTIAGDSSEVL